MVLLGSHMENQLDLLKIYDQLSMLRGHESIEQWLFLSCYVRKSPVLQCSFVNRRAYQLKLQKLYFKWAPQLIIKLISILKEILVFCNKHIHRHKHTHLIQTHTHIHKYYQTFWYDLSKHCIILRNIVNTNSASLGLMHEDHDFKLFYSYNFTTILF